MNFCIHFQNYKLGLDKPCFKHYQNFRNHILQQSANRSLACKHANTNYNSMNSFYDVYLFKHVYIYSCINGFRSFRPDFVLVRERIRGVEPKADAKTFLFGLMHGDVPSLNSLEATLGFMEKPLMVTSTYEI